MYRLSLLLCCLAATPAHSQGYDGSYARRGPGGVTQGYYSGSSSYQKSYRPNWQLRANKFNNAKSWYDGKRYYHRRQR